VKRREIVAFADLRLVVLFSYKGWLFCNAMKAIYIL